MGESIENSNKKFSRRDALKAFTIGALAALPLSYVAEEIADSSSDNTKKNVLNHLKNLDQKEAKILLNDIARYRDKLGLSGIPMGLADRCKQTEWPSSKNFQNDLPETIQSYGMRLEKVCDSVFGNNTTKLVKGILVDETLPYAIAFDRIRRVCLVPPTIHFIPIGEKPPNYDLNYTDFALHEAVGHGSDPIINPYYLTMFLLNVEHGKWRALSQAFSVENQFFNHPEDMMLPKLEKSFGEYFGNIFINNQLDQGVSGKSLDEVTDMIDSVGHSKNQTLQNIKFNKHACRQLGHLILLELRRGRINIDGYANEAYEQNMENVLKEIYAEMMKYSILYPEKISENKDILLGCQEVVNCINEKKTTLSEIKDKLTNIDNDILARNSEEQKLREQLSQAEGEETDEQQDQAFDLISEEEVAEAQQQENKLEEQKNLFNDFMSEGKIPDLKKIKHSAKTIFSLYSKVCSEVFKKHPTIQSKDDSFDPELHLWDIRKIQQAIDDRFIRNLLYNPEEIKNNIGVLKKNVKTLEKFKLDPVY